MERRKFQRIVLPVRNYNATIEYKGKSLKGEIKDFSFGGLFFETHKKIPVNEEVKIKMFSSDNSMEWAEDITGVVVRHEYNGIGIKSKRHIFDLINMLLSSEAPPQTDKVKDWFSGGA